MTDEDRIQRALNEAKKRELEERYGGSFFPEDSTIPPDVEAEWLQSIEEFERLFQNVTVTTVRHYLGDPSFVPLAEIAEAHLDKELTRVIDFFEDHGIIVHFCGPVPDDEAYRFLTEELPEVETDDIHIEGLTQDFVYEEFHPNAVLDASFSSELLLQGIFTSPVEELVGQFLQTGVTASHSAIVSSLEAFTRGIASYLEFDVAIQRCSARGDEASATASLQWIGLTEGSLEQVRGSATADVGLRKDVCDDWRVCDLTIRRPAP